MAQMQQGRVMRTAVFLMCTLIIARIFGYARNVVMMYSIGQNWITDAYAAAFAIPNVIYNIMIGGAVSSAFVPVISSYLVKGQKEDAWQVSNTIISWSVVLMGAFILVAYIFTPQIMLIYGGFEPETLRLAVALARIMLLQPLFLTLANISQGILHSHQHFTSPAIGSMIYNILVVMFGVLLAIPIEKHWPSYGIAGYSVGVVVGAMIFFVVQIPALKKTQFHFKLSFNVRHPGFIRLIKLMVPVVLGLSVLYINQLVNQTRASSLMEGSVNALSLAQQFMNLPIGIFATAIAMAIFPTMTQQAALNDLHEFKRSLSLGIRSVAFICIPSAVGLIVLREPILRLLFEFKGGQFLAQNTIFTAQALLYYSIGLTFYGIVLVLSRGFYAQQITITPVIISLITMLTNYVFSHLLVGIMAHRGLALAFSIAGIVQCSLLFVFLRRRIGHMDLRHISSSFVKTSAVCLAMGLAVWGTERGIAAVMDVMASKTAQIIQLGVSMGLAVVIFFSLAYALRMEEAKIIIDMFKRRMRRKEQHTPQTVTGEGK